MYRHLASGAKRLPRALTSILVQRTTLPLTDTLSVEVGIATSAGARNLYLGEAWAVGGDQDATKKNAGGSSSTTVQVGVLDSRDARSFSFLNSAEQAAARHWGDQVLSYLPLSSRFLFAGYAANRGGFSAVTTASLVAANLAAQQFPSSSNKSSRSDFGGSRSGLAIAGVGGGGPGNAAVMHQLTQSFAADAALREALQTSSSAQKWRKMEDETSAENGSTNGHHQHHYLDTAASGCRGVWANISYDGASLNLSISNIGDSRGFLSSSGKQASSRTSSEPSAKLTDLRNLAKELPSSFNAESLAPAQIPKTSDPEVDVELEEQHVKPSAIHEKLVDRRKRLHPLTTDHRPLRPEEQRRIGRAAAEMEMTKSVKNTKSAAATAVPPPKTLDEAFAKMRDSASGKLRLPREIVDENEFLCGDPAVDVSRAFGHFHLKDSVKSAPDEQLLSCKPDTTFRMISEGDVLVLGNKALFQGVNEQQVSRFIGAWSLTSDSVAAHVIEYFDKERRQEAEDTADCAKGLVQLAQLNGAEHNLSALVLRVVANDKNNNAIKINSKIEYAIPGQVHPYLTEAPEGSGVIYCDALRRDAWRLGFETVGDFAAARRDLLEQQYGSFFQLLEKHGGSVDRPSVECPEQLWAQMVHPLIGGVGLLESHPQLVSSMVRELQAEMDWCVKESKHS